MKTWANKTRILQSLASTYPCNAILFNWGRLPSTVCTLCGGDNESLSHVQCSTGGCAYKLTSQAGDAALGSSWPGVAAVGYPQRDVDMTARHGGASRLLR